MKAEEPLPMTKSRSDPEDWGSVPLYKDEWFVVLYGSLAVGNIVHGPFKSRMKAKHEADKLSDIYRPTGSKIRVVHSVFTS